MSPETLRQRDYTWARQFPPVTDSRLTGDTVATCVEHLISYRTDQDVLNLVMFIARTHLPGLGDENNQDKLRCHASQQVLAKSCWKILFSFHENKTLLKYIRAYHVYSPMTVAMLK